MMASKTVKGIDKTISDGVHTCLIYETDEEHRACVTSFLQDGVNCNEKVFYISDASNAKTIRDYLEQAGLSLSRSPGSGELNVLSVQETYLWGGAFQPDRMIGMLQTQSERALEEGYSGSRFTGEMTWALHGAMGSERLIEYEAKLNEGLEGYKATTLCQYDRRWFSPSILLYMLITHPLLYIGSQMYENFYYEFSPECLTCETASESLSRWLDDILGRRFGVASLAQCVESPLMAT